MKRTTTLLLFALAMSTGVASASVVFDNLSNESCCGHPIANYETPAENQSFTNITDDGLTSVTVGLSPGSVTSGSINVDLYTDNGGTPGTFLDTLGTISDSSVKNSSNGQMLVNAPAGISLAGNTQYFIVLFGTTTPGSGDDALWMIANDTSRIGTAGQTGTSGSAPMVMQVVTDSAVTPEPSLVWLCGVVLLGMAARRYRVIGNHAGRRTMSIALSRSRSPRCSRLHTPWFALAAALLSMQPGFGSSISSTAGCVLGSFCYYTDAASFLNALGPGVHPGQENFETDPPGSYIGLGPITANGSYLDVCGTSSNDCGWGKNDVYNGQGNFAIFSAVATLASSYGYLGFDYHIDAPPGTQPDFVISTPNGQVTGGSITGLAQNGFLGVVSDVGLSIESFVPYPTHIDNLLWSGGAGTVPSGPVNPYMCLNNPNLNPISPSGYCIYGFYTSLPLMYVDPVVTSSYTYQTLDGSLFTSVGGFPSGFTSPFDVSSNGTDYGLFSPGQTLVFPNGGVSQFTIGGINPAVDGTSPTAFPVQIGENTIGASFEAIPSGGTPEPASSVLGGLGLILLILRGRFKKCAQAKLALTGRRCGSASR